MHPESRDPMERREEIHRYFRGSGELAKILHQVAFFAELGVAIVAVHGLLQLCVDCIKWQPLAVIGLALIAAISHSLAVWVELFSHRCRRASLLAFALGKEIEPRLFFEIKGQAPPLALSFGKLLPAKSLEEYYQPTCPSGSARLRELYAHSAFYNWRLQRIYCWLAGSVGALLLIVGFVLTYYFLISPAPEVQATLLDGFYSVVLAFIALRALQKAFIVYLNLSSMKRALESLLAESLPNGDVLQELILHYEVERARTTLIPTFLYRLRRNRLEREWVDRREVLGCGQKEAQSDTEVHPSIA